MKAVPANDGGSIVDRVYAELKAMTVRYVLKPGERINEGEIARQLGVSRTPLREALNRLNTEGMLTFSPGRGFYCRELNAQEVFELYELRKALEVAAVRLAVERASDVDIEALISFLDRDCADPENRDVGELVHQDEIFHERLIGLAGNREMRRILENVNSRIHFVRWIDMDRGNRPHTRAEHRRLAAALKARDVAECVATLERHIERRKDQIVSAIKVGYAQIYMAQTERDGDG